MTTPVTDRPLTAEDVALLRQGDVLRFDDGSLYTFDHLSHFKNVVDPIVCTDGRNQSPDRFTFIARPDADGWIEWRGGENPVPGEMVEVKFRFGGSGASGLSDEVTWHHDGSVCCDIIAYRLARPPSVSADPVGGVTSGAGERGDETDPRIGVVMAALDNFAVLAGRITQTQAAFVLSRLDLHSHLTPSPPVQLSEREREDHHSALMKALEPVRVAINRAANRGPESKVSLTMADAMGLIRLAALTRTTGEG